MNKLNRWLNLVFPPMLNALGILIAILLLHAGCSYSPFQNAFTQLPHHGNIVPLNENIKIDQSGGHIQGVQIYQEGSKKILFLSVSSNEVAFMVRAEINGEARIVSTDTLLRAPFRHAGGFQIYKQYLAIGIEDNKLRNTSRVMVYDLEKEEIWSDPVHVIKRDGAYERATAGAVGMTSIDVYYLIAVANWHSRDLDFYICPDNQIVKAEEGFQLIGSLNMESASRKNWVDSTWRSYQNINLFVDSDDRLYLVGFATTDNGENVADLFSVDFKEGVFNHPEQFQNLDGLFSLTKVDSRKFETDGQTSFRWGAGLSRNYNGELTLIASPEHIDQFSNVELYSK